MGKSWRKPQGWQGIFRENEEGAFAVFHIFGGEIPAHHGPGPRGKGTEHRAARRRVGAKPVVGVKQAARVKAVKIHQKASFVVGRRFI